MARRAGQWLIGLALAFSLGTHWLTLQMVAWTGMFVSFSRTDSVVSALVKTFDGKHTCRLCLAVGEGRRAERKSEESAPVRRLEFTHVATAASAPILLPPAPDLFPCPPSIPPDRSEAPPVPPPRVG